MNSDAREAPAGAAAPSPATPRLALRRLAVVVVPALFVGLLAVGMFRSAGPRSVAGSRVPEFELPVLGGPGTIGSRDLKGLPVVVNFWASWCIPCREEAPVFEAAWQKYRPRGVRFLGVNMQDAEEDAKAFVAEFGLTYPSVRDVDQELARDFGVRGLPETFFIDHRWRFLGVGAGEQIGTRGKIVVLGAIPPALLRGQIEVLVVRMEKDRR